MSAINNPRIFLWGALALLLFADYDAWMRDYAAPSPAAVSAPQSAAPAAPGFVSGRRRPAQSLGTRTISMRRLRARLSGVSLGAIGWYSP